MLDAKGVYYATHKGEKGVVDAEKDVRVMDTMGAGYIAFLHSISYNSPQGRIHLALIVLCSVKKLMYILIAETLS